MGAIQSLVGRRKRILISTLQLRLLALNLVYFCVILLVFAAFLLLPLMLHLRNASLEASAENLAAANGFLFLHRRLWPAVLVVLVLLALHSLIVSHRVAGPLYRFRRVFEAVTAGDLSARAMLRKHDYLVEEAEALNRMLAALAERTAGPGAQAAALRAALADLERARQRGAADGLDESIRRLSTLVDQLAAGREP